MARSRFTPGYNSQRDLEEFQAQRAAIGYNPEIGDESYNAPSRADMTISPEEAGIADYKPTDMIVSQEEALRAPAVYDPELGDMTGNVPAAAAPYYSDPEAASRVPALSPVNTYPADMSDGQIAALSQPKSDPFSQATGVATGGVLKGPATPQAPQRRVQAPMMAASAQRRPAPPPAIDAGPEPRSKLGTLLTQLPNAIGNLAAASTMSRKSGGETTLAGIQARNQQSAEMGARDDAARTKYANRKGWLKRQAGRDALAAEDRSRRLTREDRADKLSADAMDPNSVKNQTFRKAVEKEYPEFWATLTPEQQTKLTIGDAQAMSPALEGEQARRAASAKEKERIQALTDKKDLEDHKAKLRKPRTGFGFYASGPGIDAAQVGKALAEAFGGEDKVPATVKTELAMAGSIGNPQKKAEALKAVLRRADDVKGRAADDARQDQQNAEKKAAKEEADFKERKAYQAESKELREAGEVAGEISSEFKKIGIDPAKGYQGQDIPGYGRVESFMPGAVMNERAQQMRSRVNDYASLLVRARSGKAATDKERKFLQEVLGTSGGMSEAAMYDAVKRMDQISKRMQLDVDANFPAAAKAYAEEVSKQNRGGGEGGNKKTVTVKNPATGETRQVYEDKLEEAKKRGWVQ